MSASKWLEHADLPVAGWDPVEVKDAPGGTCELCGKTPITRHVEMRHSAYPGTLWVGQSCAKDMMGGETYRARYSVLTRLLAVQRRWRQLTWRPTSKGNPSVLIQGHRVVVYLATKGYRISVFSKGEPEPTKGKMRYPTEEAAKAAAFKALQHVMLKALDRE